MNLTKYTHAPGIQIIYATEFFIKDHIVYKFELPIGNFMLLHPYVKNL